MKDDQPQFDAGEAFEFLKEKGGKDYPSLYKILHKQQEFHGGDRFVLTYDKLFDEDNHGRVIPKSILTSSPYVREVEPRLKKLDGSSYELTIKNVKSLSDYIVFSWIDLVIDMPKLEYFGYIMVSFGHEILDLSRCKSLKSINYIGNGIHTVRLSKGCPLAKNERSMSISIHKSVKVELV